MARRKSKKALLKVGLGDIDYITSESPSMQSKTKKKPKVKRGKRGQRKTKKDLYIPQNEPYFEKKRKVTDTIQKEKLNHDTDFQSQFQAGQLTYTHLVNMIDTQIKKGKGWGGNFVLDALEEEINQYGFEKTMWSIGDAPSEIIEEAVGVMEQSDAAQIDASIDKLLELVRGAYPDYEDLKQLEEAKEKDDYIDNGNEEGTTEYPDQNYNNLPYYNE